MSEFQREHQGYRGASARRGYYDPDSRSLTGSLDLCLDDGSHVVLTVRATATQDGGLEIAEERATHNNEAHWEQVIAAGLDPNTVIIGGRVYSYQPDNPGGLQGFGGHLFRLRRDDGRVVTTRNLWAGMTVPPVFRDRLSDNAVFLPDDPADDSAPVESGAVQHRAEQRRAGAR
jgi:hypothetical protein